MRETVSIIIPCFNPGPWLAPALASVRAQAPDAWGHPWVGEVVLVDDGSTDGSVAAAAAQWPAEAPPLRLVQQANAGVAAARNRGVAEATGDWIAFLDADDAWHPEKLARQMAALQAHPGIAMACSGWQVWRPPSTHQAPPVPALPPPARTAPRALYAELLEDCSVWTSTVVMRRSLFLTLGGFEAGRAVGEDYDLWLRAARSTCVLVLPEPLATYRIHGANTTLRAPTRNHQMEVVERALSTWGYCDPWGHCADRQRVQRAMARSWRSHAGSCLMAQDLHQAQQALHRARALQPWQATLWRLQLQAWWARLRPSG